jgi:ATP-dependent DNA helicase RecG
MIEAETRAAASVFTAQVQELLAQGMGAGLHWFPADVTVERLATVLVGMANTSGGTVILGVSPRSAQIQGIRDLEAALDIVFQAALLADPPLVLPVPRQCMADNLHVLYITVPAGLPHVYSLEGRYLGRDGSQTSPLSARRLRQLLVERGSVQFEAQIAPTAALEDLDMEKVAAYIQALGLPGDEPAEQTLLRRGCLLPLSAASAPKVAGIEKTASLRPTYAALLLFGRHPQQWLPNASILAARFSGATLADQFIKQEINGTLVEQLHQAEAFMRNNLRSVVRLVGLARQETLEYPLEALRELLVNAVAHRDYNAQGDNIHLFIFSDRIEIHSPGGLPGPVNLQNLLEARFSRNAVIAQVLSDLGFVERLGYGLNRVMDVMRQNGLRPPRFEEIANSFRVTLFGDALFAVPSGSAAALPDLQAYTDLELNPRQQILLAFLLARKRITNREYQELSPDVHAETLRRDLADLVGRGLLIKVGDKRATYYILKK